MANLYFEAQLDADQLKRELREINKRMTNFTKDVQTQGTQIDSTFKRIGAAMAGYFSITAAEGFLDQVIQVRGEFQQLDIALQTMLGSKSEADKLMAEVVSLAAKTPFSLTELGQGAKRLLAFKEPTDQVGESLRRLGDLAAGASVPITDLIQAYGKVSAKGKMQAEELNQFAERGIPIISELAEVVGATDKEIYKMAEQGKIGFEELQQAIKNMTDEGGQFYNLMEKQSGSLTGQISNLGDAWDRMLNEIGQKNEGIIYSGIGTLNSLVENYETVIDVLKVVIASYGAYKAAVVAAWMAQKAMALGQTIRSLQLMTKGINSATRAQIAFNTAAKANPWGLLAAGIAAVVTILPMFNKEQKEAVDVTKDITEQFGKEKQSAEALFTQLKNTNAGTRERSTLIEKLNSKYGTNLKNLQDEKEFLSQIDVERGKVIEKLKEEMILKSEQARITENLSQQQVLKGLIQQTEAEIKRLEILNSPQAVEAAQKRLQGQIDSLDELKKQLSQISKEAAEQLEDLFGKDDGGSEGGAESVFDVSAYEKTLSDQKKAYEAYNDALRSAREEDKGAVEEYYKDLIRQGKDYEEYLINQLESFKNNIQAKVAIYQAATNSGIILSKDQTPGKLNGKGVTAANSITPDSLQLASMDAAKKRWEDIGKATRSAMNVENLTGFSNKLIDTAYQMQELARTVGEFDSEMGDLMNGVADAVGQVGNIAKMSAEGDTLGVITAGLNGALQVTGMLINSAKERKAVEEAFYYSIRQQQHEYNLALNEQLRLQAELNENVFMKDQEGRLTSGINALRDANKGYLENLAQLDEGEAKIGKRDAVDWGSIGAGLGGGAAAGAAIGSVVPVVGTAIGAVVGGIAGAIGGLFGGKKKKDVYGDLLAEYPELIQKAEDGQKQLNVELAQTLIDQDLISKSTKETLQNAIDWSESVKEAQEQIKSVIGDLAGGMGDDLRNALVSAFEDGTDAAKEFGESVENTLEDILSQMIFQQVYGSIFDQLQEEMESSYDLGGDRSWIDDFSRMFERTSNATDDFNKALDEARKQGEQAGFHLWGGGEDASLTGAVKGVSEETASLIGGQMNAIRINQAESLRIMNESIRYQSEIAANTRYNRYLESIDSKLNVIKGSGSDPLKAKGL